MDRLKCIVFVYLNFPSMFSSFELQIKGSLVMSSNRKKKEKKKRKQSAARVLVAKSCSIPFMSAIYTVDGGQVNMDDALYILFAFFLEKICFIYMHRSTSTSGWRRRTRR